MRQSLVLSDLRGAVLNPTIAYDPVARIVTITPTSALQVDQMYRLSIVSPASSADANGLRAIDGATLAASSLCATRSAQQCTIEFPVVAGGSSATLPTVDFCKDIYPIFSSGRCGGSACHGGKLPAAGLLLDLPKNIAATAIGRVAHGSNTGPRSAAQSAGPIFGIDMPIVDPGPGSPAAGDPSQSWLLYKVLMGAPASQSSAQASSCDGGVATPTDVTPLHSLAWQPLSDAERAALSNLVLGREMPFPVAGTPTGQGPLNLTVAELERVSRWIAQSAPVPATCGDCVP